MSQPQLADRYGRRRGGRSSRWIVWVLGALVVAAGLAVAYVGYLNFGPKDVDGQQASYDVVDDSTMTIRFTVTRQDPGKPAVCIVRARSKDGTETGRREVLVEGSTAGTVEVTSTVRTSKPPAIGDVYGCSLDVPAYLKAG